MSDKSPTERLREMLDERGIEYEKHDPLYDLPTSCKDTRWGDASYREWPNGTIRFGATGTTPEQAIAATLGRPTFDTDLEKALSFMRIWISEDAHLGESDIGRRLEKTEGLRKLDAIEQAIAATLGSGKLTAEQVRKAIFDGSVYASYDGSQYYADGISMQAIADELNATSALRGVCHDEGGIDDNGQQVFCCDMCRCILRLYDGEGANNLITGFVYDYPRFCPQCGRKVVC